MRANVPIGASLATTARMRDKPPDVRGRRGSSSHEAPPGGERAGRTACVPPRIGWPGNSRTGAAAVSCSCRTACSTRTLDISAGPGRPGCVREIVDACADNGLGMVQLPCPEEHAWGGVQKRWLLRLYGSARWLPGPLRRALLPVLLAYTRRVYARLARDTARRISDYRRSGVDVVALVGVDGSPSCGVERTMDIPTAVTGWREPIGVP